jgi:predicted 3-demethylubiquinone-9 3-methyltransferase (glyoxalase superfamily)
MAIRGATQLMFQGQAEEALDFYADSLPEARIDEIERVGDDGPGVPGSVARARLRLGDHVVQIFDSPVGHDFTFTPSISLVVELDTLAEVDAAFAALADGGQVLMPLGAYPFSTHFGWVADRFGVSWQLLLRA